MSPESKLFEAVLFRALCDALGFTGESDKRLHAIIVQDAREWFYDRAYADTLEDVCDNAGYNFQRVRESACRLIEARQSGDHSHIPEFWRVAFRRNRMPSFSAFAEAIDKQLKRA